MYCKKCGKKIYDDSIFCKYCGTNLLTSNQDNNNDSILNANNDSSNVKQSGKVSKNNYKTIINVFFIFIVITAIVFFVPSKEYYIAVVSNETFEGGIVHVHLFNLFKEEITGRIKPPGGFWGNYNIEYKINYLRGLIQILCKPLN